MSLLVFLSALFLVNINVAKAQVPVRKEMRSLTKQELNRYLNAWDRWVNEEVPADVSLLTNFATAVSFHIQAAIQHPDGNITAYFPTEHHYDRMHGGPHFLLLHSVMLHEYEKALQYYDPSVAAHYWDWTIDPTGIFTEDLFGELADNGTVVNGFLKDFPYPLFSQVVNDEYLEWAYILFNTTKMEFENSDCRNLPIHLDPSFMIKYLELLGNRTFSCAEYGEQLRSTYGDVLRYSIEPSFPIGTADDVRVALKSDSYIELYCTIFFTNITRERCKFGLSEEGNLHGLVHAYYGVSQNSLASNPWTSPLNPVFFAHHSEVERIHQAWHLQLGVYSELNVDPCGGYNVTWKDYTQPPLMGLHDTFAIHVSDLYSTPAKACEYFYGDNLKFIYDSFPSRY